jgi:hypothetical protein
MNSLLRPKGLMQSYLSFALSAGGGCPEIRALDPYCTDCNIQVPTISSLRVFSGRVHRRDEGQFRDRGMP